MQRTMPPKVIIAACCLALHSGAVCADDKIYLACLTSERFPANLAIDLKAGIVAGDWESKITRATETSIEFEGGTANVLLRQAKHGTALWIA
jgi:hypothetical protein